MKVLGDKTPLIQSLIEKYVPFGSIVAPIAGKLIKDFTKGRSIGDALKNVGRDVL